MPAPGVRVGLSPEYNPPILKGLKVHPDNPFRFDFILDKGDSQSSNDALKDESSKLIKYFLASLTIPEKDLWVNLSPYEKDRIVPESFGQTEMGRDLLAEDYMLKQITASLIYPEGEVGKKFWKRIYQEAAKKFGTTNIPVNTFNKVWIVPEKAVVYENAKAGTAYVVESKLKVMLEQDYLALSHNVIPAKAVIQDTSALGSQIVREIVIPELTKEVNEDKNFAQLRQVYNSLILATWYKKKIKDSILSQVYANKNKVAGIVSKGPISSTSYTVEAIYQRYLQAFKKGAYNYIKEEQDPITQQPVPRKYFSGGMDLAMNVTNLGSTELQTVNTIDPAQLNQNNLEIVSSQFDMAMKGDVPKDQVMPAKLLPGSMHTSIQLGVDILDTAETMDDVIAARKQFIERLSQSNSALATRIGLTGLEECDRLLQDRNEKYTLAFPPQTYALEPKFIKQIEFNLSSLHLDGLLKIVIYKNLPYLSVEPIFPNESQRETLRLIVQDKNKIRGIFKNVPLNPESEILLTGMAWYGLFDLLYRQNGALNFTSEYMDLFANNEIYKNSKVLEQLAGDENRPQEDYFVDVIKEKMSSSKQYKILVFAAGSGVLVNSILRKIPNISQVVEYDASDVSNQTADAKRKHELPEILYRKVRQITADVRDFDTQLKGKKFDFIISTASLRLMNDEARENVVNFLKKRSGLNEGGQFIYMDSAAHKGSIDNVAGELSNSGMEIKLSGGHFLGHRDTMFYVFVHEYNKNANFRAQINQMMALQQTDDLYAFLYRMAGVRSINFYILSAVQNPGIKDSAQISGQEQRKVSTWAEVAKEGFSYEIITNGTSRRVNIYFKKKRYSSGVLLQKLSKEIVHISLLEPNFPQDGVEGRNQALLSELFRVLELNGYYLLGALDDKEAKEVKGMKEVRVDTQRIYSILKQKAKEAEDRRLSTIVGTSTIYAQIEMPPQDSNPAMSTVDRAMVGETGSNMARSEQAEDFYDFSQNRLQVRKLEEKLQEAMAEVKKDGSVRAVIIGGTRYLRSGARPDVDVLLKGLKDEQVWKAFVHSLADILRSVSGIEALILNDKYPFTEERSISLIFKSKRGEIAGTYIHVLMGEDISLKEWYLETLKLVKDDEISGWAIDENFLKYYFMAEYYVGQEDIFQKFIARYNDPKQKKLLLRDADHALRRRMLELKRLLSEITGEEINRRIQERQLESAAGPDKLKATAGDVVMTTGNGLNRGDSAPRDIPTNADTWYARHWALDEYFLGVLRSQFVKNGKAFNRFAEMGLGFADEGIGMASAPTFFEWFRKLYTAKGFSSEPLKVFGFDVSSIAFNYAHQYAESKYASFVNKNLFIIKGGFNDLSGLVQQHGALDVIRTLNVFKYYSVQVQNYFREKALDVLRDGGFFIEGDWDWYILYQKQGGQFQLKQIIIKTDDANIGISLDHLLERLKSLQDQRLSDIIRVLQLYKGGDLIVPKGMKTDSSHKGLLILHIDDAAMISRDFKLSVQRELLMQQKVNNYLKQKNIGSADTLNYSQTIQAATWAIEQTRHIEGEENPVFLDIVNRLLTEDQIRGYEARFKHFDSIDLIMILQKAHSISEELSVYGVRKETLGNEVLLNRLTTIFAHSNALIYRVLERAGMMGANWDVIKPDQETLSLLRQGDGQGVFRQIAGKNITEISSQVKAFLEYFDIDIQEMESTVLLQLIDSYVNNPIERMTESQQEQALTLIADRFKQYFLNDFITVLSVTRRNSGFIPIKLFSRGVDGIAMKVLLPNGQAQLLKLNIPQNGLSVKDFEKNLNDVVINTKELPGIVRNFGVYPGIILSLSGEKQVILEFNEFIDGESMRTAISREQMELNKVLGLLLQFIVMHRSLYEKGFINRDARNLNNILVDRQERAVLVDRGNVMRKELYVREYRGNDGVPPLFKAKQELLVTIIRFLTGVQADRIHYGGDLSGLEDLSESRFVETKHISLKPIYDLIIKFGPDQKDDIPQMSVQLERAIQEIRQKLSAHGNGKRDSAQLAEQELKDRAMTDNSSDLRWQKYSERYDAEYEKFIGKAGARELGTGIFLEDIVSTINHLPTNKKIIMIAVEGFSGALKTTIAQEIVQQLNALRQLNDEQERRAVYINGDWFIGDRADRRRQQKNDLSSRDITIRIPDIPLREDKFESEVLKKVDHFNQGTSPQLVLDLQDLFNYDDKGRLTRIENKVLDRNTVLVVDHNYLLLPQFKKYFDYSIRMLVLPSIGVKRRINRDSSADDQQRIGDIYFRIHIPSMMEYLNTNDAVPNLTLTTDRAMTGQEVMSPEDPLVHKWLAQQHLLFEHHFRWQLDDEHKFFIAQDAQGDAVGAVVFHKERWEEQEYIVMDALETLPEKRERGIGTMLVKEVIEWAFAKGKGKGNFRTNKAGDLIRANLAEYDVNQRAKLRGYFESLGFSVENPMADANVPLAEEADIEIKMTMTTKSAKALLEGFQGKTFEIDPEGFLIGRIYNPEFIKRERDLATQRKTIVFDRDGTLGLFDKKLNRFILRKGIEEQLSKLKKMGYRLVLWTRAHTSFVKEGTAGLQDYFDLKITQENYVPQFEDNGDLSGQSLQELKAAYAFLGPQPGPILDIFKKSRGAELKDITLLGYKFIVDDKIDEQYLPEHPFFQQYRYYKISPDEPVNQLADRIHRMILEGDSAQLVRQQAADQAMNISTPETSEEDYRRFFPNKGREGMYFEQFKYQTALHELVKEKSRGRVFYPGSGVDMTTALLTTNGNEFDMVDQFVPTYEEIVHYVDSHWNEDFIQNHYIQEKKSTGQGATLDLKYHFKEILVAELKALGIERDQLHITSIEGGFRLVFKKKFPGENYPRERIFNFIREDISAFHPKGEYDVLIQKAGWDSKSEFPFDHLFGNIIPYINPGAFVITNPYTYDKSGKEIQVDILKMLNRTGHFEAIQPTGTIRALETDLIRTMDRIRRLSGEAIQEGYALRMQVFHNQLTDFATVNRNKINETGGIDLTSDKTLSVQNSGQGIKFHIDPAMLQQLQDAPGFVPVIIDVQPMTDLRQFLGIT